MNKLKTRILTNKYLTSIIISIIIGCICYSTVLYSIDKSVNVVRVSVASTTIKGNTLITEEMIKYIEIPKSYLVNHASFYEENNSIVGMYVKPGFTLYEGSLFIKESLVNNKEIIKINNLALQPSEVLVHVSTEGIGITNFLKKGDRLDTYFTANFRDEGIGKIVSGLIIENSRILHLLDSNFHQVTESNETQSVRYVALAMSESDYSYYLIAKELGELTLSISYKSFQENIKSNLFSINDLRSYLDIYALDFRNYEQ